jgi:hypothetical protein
MWCALGTCFESLERRGDAIACFERAALFADHRDGAAALRLAKLYRQAGNVAAACRWYAVHVEEKEAGAGSGLGAGAAGSDVAEALLYLAGTAKAEGRVGREEREKELGSRASRSCRRGRRAFELAGGAAVARSADPVPPLSFSSLAAARGRRDVCAARRCHAAGRRGPRRARAAGRDSARDARRHACRRRVCEVSARGAGARGAGARGEGARGEGARLSLIHISEPARLM